MSTSTGLLYYVYAYLRKTDLTPYYIGKGCLKRYKEKYSITIPSDISRIVFLETNLTELGAFAIERRMIKWYGRKDLGTGILRNKTDGGEGSSGLIHTQETRDKLSVAGKGKPKPPRTKEHTDKIQASRKINGKPGANTGRTFSEEHCANLSSSAKKRIQSKDTCTKISITMKGRPAHNKGKPSAKKGKLTGKNGPAPKLLCPHCNQLGGKGVIFGARFAAAAN